MNKCISIFFAGLGLYHQRNALNCQKSRKILEDYQGEYGKLLGSSSNDSFITESSQQYNLTGAYGNGLGGKPIKKDNNQYVFPVSANHFNEPSHPDIWGKGGHADVNDNSSDMDYKRLKNGSIQRKSSGKESLDNEKAILESIFDSQDWEIKE